MNKIYYRTICNGKIIFHARIHRTITGRYGFETSINNDSYVLNINMPLFQTKEEAIRWLMINWIN